MCAGPKVLARYLRDRGLAALLLLALMAAGPAAAEPLGHKRPRGVELRSLEGLTTQHGTPFAVSSLRGRPFVVAFGFTHCPDVCPTTLIDLKNHIEVLGPGADRVGVLFITVDPERDTAQRLQSFLASFDTRFIGLTGDEAEIASAAHAFNAFYERVLQKDGGYTIDHTLKVAFFDRYGLLASRVDVARAPAKQVHTLLQRLLAQ